MKEHVCSLGCKKGRIFNRALSVYEPCPECTGLARKVEIEKDTEGVLTKNLLIPSEYVAVRPSDRDLLRLPVISARYASESIERVGALLESINKSIYNQEILKVSCYIHTSNEVDARQFVFGAQKMALEKGLGVAPYISLNTLYGLQKSGDYARFSVEGKDDPRVEDMSPETRSAYDGHRFSTQTGVTYYDYITADLCIVEATANTLTKGWNVLADLLAERARMGLPVYVIGYWGSKGGGSGSTGLRYLLQPDGTRPRLDLLSVYELVSKRMAGSGGSTGGSPGLTLRTAPPVASVPTGTSPVRSGVRSAEFLGS